jgi:hypothetical protein
MKRSSILIIVCLSVASVPPAGCWKKSGIPLDGSDGGTDSDSDTDSDVDSDTDSDSDSDTDSDTDSDGDTDTWPNGDTAPEGYGDVTELCWVTTFGGPGHAEVRDVVALSDGSSAVAGYFSETMTFDHGGPDEVTFSYGGDDVSGFLARFDADGGFTWARHITAGIEDLAVTQTDALVVVGEFHGSITFSEGEPDEETLSAFGEQDLFLARYNGDGDLVWARQDGGLEDVRARSLAVLSNGTYVVGGKINSSTVFGLGEEHETTIETGSGTTMFLARYYEDGMLAWARAVCDNACSPGRDIAPHPTNGTFFVTGDFAWSATFGMGQENETTLTSTGLGYDETWSMPWGLFMSLYDMDGMLQWVEMAELNVSDVAPTGVAMGESSFVSAGSFTGDMGFEYGEPDEVVLHAPYEADDGGGTFYYAMYAARITDEGEVLWALGSASGFEGGAALGVNAVPLGDDQLVMSGMFFGAVNFGLGEPAETWLVASGEGEPFAAIYDGDGNLVWVARVGSSWGSEGNAAAAAGLGDGTFVLAGELHGEAEFLVGEDEYLTVSSYDDSDCFLLHVCPSGGK